MLESEKLPAVATKTYRFCKKCDCDRYHVVLAHTGLQTAKLECEVCKSKSTLKLSIKASGRTSAVTKKTSSSRKKKAPSAAAVASQWKELLAKVNLEAKKPYSMRQNFHMDEAIEHPKFGVGVVTGVAAQQIQVVFEGGVKALVHNRA